MPLNVIHQNRINAVTENGNTVVGFSHENTIKMGAAEDVTVLAYVRSSYPAIYNHVVQCANHLTESLNGKQEKRSMRGGRLLLYRYMVLLALLLSFGFGIASIDVKPCATVPFVLSFIHIDLAIYNINVFLSNRPLLHPLLAHRVPAESLPNKNFMNNFFRIPITHDRNITLCGATLQPEEILTVFKMSTTQTNHITILLYTDGYLRHLKFPKECIVHLILFLIMFFLAISFVVTTRS
jgi:hypothetical protein